MAGGERPLLSRTDVVIVLVVTAGLVTPLTALSSRPAGWTLIIDAILSAVLGLVVALIVVSGVRVVERWWSVRARHQADRAASRAMTIFGWGLTWEPTPWCAVQGAAWAAVWA